jgi:C-terminal processing protease CtpA/Prc
VTASKDDLEFYDLCIEYVASLNDAHDVFTLPADFSASLSFTVDIYEGRVLVDSITRSRLPVSQYAFQIGDELVSVDGKSAEQLIQAFLKYSIAANLSSTRRSAASRIVSRPQNRMPYAHQIGDTADVAVRRQNGDVVTYKIPWSKSGTPLTFVGPVPMPKAQTAKSVEEQEPEYMQALRRLQNVRLADDPGAYLNMGSRTPIFSLPQGFVRRLGGASSDVFYSGTWQSGGYRIGFIRIPNYSGTTTAVQQFQREIAYFQDNTDGLIIDDMRNPGGDGCYVEQLLTYVMPGPFRVLGFEVRATRLWINNFSYDLALAQSSGAPPDVIDLLTSLLAQVQTAYASNRGKTDAMPICTTSLIRDPATDSSGKMIAYTKPAMVLADELSASGADMFPAIFQDNGRGPVFGMRSMGAGGSVVDWDIGTFSEGHTRVTISQMNRRAPIRTPEYPAAPYVENIGVRPDIAVDYMTLDNLLNGGKTFVDAFTAAMVDLIQKSQPQP